MIPKIAVVVCTHNRAGYLPNALESLAHQSATRKDCEIIIVDNLSTDETPQIAQKYCNTYLNFRYVLESELGIGIARNSGLANTDAEIIAYCDDDAIPAPDWIERIVTRFPTLDASTAAIGGAIDPVWEAPRPPWLTDRMLLPLSARLEWSDEPTFLRKGQWISEVNCAYRRELLLRYGGFTTKLGRRGSSLLSGENAVNEWLERDGYRFFFDPAIRVRHVIHAHRINRGWLRRRCFWQGVTTAIVAEERRASGHDAGYWHALELPQAMEQWIALFDDAEDPDTFQVECDQLEQLGYLLALKGVVGGN